MSWLSSFFLRLKNRRMEKRKKKNFFSQVLEASVPGFLAGGQKKNKIFFRKKENLVHIFDNDDNLK